MRTLAPPLRVAWSVTDVDVPPFVWPSVVFATMLRPEGGSDLICLDRDGTERWRADGKPSGVMLLGSRVLALMEKPLGKWLVAYDLSSGAELLRHSCDFSMDVVINQHAYVGTDVISSRKPCVVELARVDLEPKIRMRWKLTSKDGEEAGRFSFSVGYSAGLVLAAREAALEAIDADTGELVWARHTDSPGLHGWTPVPAGPYLIISTSKGTEILDLRTGTRLWAVQSRGIRVAVDGDLYILENAGDLAQYSLATGKKERVLRLRESMKRRWGFDAGLVTAPAFSVDHFYAGDDAGRLWAFERNSGEAVWWEMPAKGGAFELAAPILCDDALFVNAVSRDLRGQSALYCYTS